MRTEKVKSKCEYCWGSGKVLCHGAFLANFQGDCPICKGTGKKSEALTQAADEMSPPDKGKVK